MPPADYYNEHNRDTKVKQWLEAVAPYNHLDLKFNSAKAALIVIDMQKFFLTPEQGLFTPGGLAVLPNIKTLVESFRAADRPVIFTAHAHKDAETDGGLLTDWWPAMCMQDAADSAMHPDLAPLPGEKVIIKRRYSGFYQTDLELSLRCLGVEQLVITGLMTNICCESTARDGFFRDFSIFFVADGNGALNEELHLSTLRNIAFGFGKIVTTGEVVEGVR